MTLPKEITGALDFYRDALLWTASDAEREAPRARAALESAILADRERLESERDEWRSVAAKQAAMHDDSATRAGRAEEALREASAYVLDQHAVRTRLAGEMGGHTYDNGWRDALLAVGIILAVFRSGEDPCIPPSQTAAETSNAAATDGDEPPAKSEVSNA